MKTFFENDFIGEASAKIQFGVKVHRYNRIIPFFIFFNNKCARSLDESIQIVILTFQL